MTQSLTRQNLGFDFESPVYRFGALQTTASNALCVPIIYGQVKAAGNKIWQSPVNKTFNAIIAFGEGQINSISNVQLNDYDISTLSGCSADTYLGNGTQSIDPRVTGSAQPDKAALVGGLKYTAYIALTITPSNKVASNYLNVTADIQGKLINVYTNPTTCTKKYSNNPAWCIFDFLTCLNGCNMSVDSLDIQSFITAAGYCDTKVGSETDPRFSLNLILDQRKSRAAWLNQMLVTCRGNLVYNANNKLSLVIEQDNASVQDFTPDNIIKGSEYFWTTQKYQRADILRMRYIYPTEQCARVFAIAESDSFLNDPPIVQEIEAFGITNFKQASRLAWFYLNQANNCNKFITFKTTQIALDRMVGDVITFTSSFLGYVKKKMRIVSISEAQNGQIQITCRENNGAESATLTTNLTGIATLTTNLTGNHNDLFYSSVLENGTANITVKYTDPYSNNRPLIVSVSEQDINVLLATNSSGAITSTSAQVMAAIQANQAASALVTVANAPGNNGSGIVTAMARTSLSGNINDLVYTSVLKNETANNITVKYTDTYSNSQPFGLSVSGQDINVTLATNSTGAITTTAADIKTAIQNSSTASALVTVANASGNNGSGIVTAMVKTNLAGGTIGLYSDTLGGVAPELSLININDSLDVPDDVQGFSSAQYQNTIVLNWQPIDNTSVTYEIREGTSWDISQPISPNLTGSSYTVLNIQKRTYNYWIKAVNKYKTYSTNAKGFSITISDIPETNTILNEDILDSDILEGTLDKCFANSGGIILNSSVDWASSSLTWDSPNMYYASNGYWGTNCEKSGTYTTKVYDLGTILYANIDISYSLYRKDDSSNIEINWRYSDDNVKWTDWGNFSHGTQTFRYYQFQITLNSSNNEFTALTSFVVNIDITNRDLPFSNQVISDANAGVTVTFNPVFVNDPSVVANISDGTNGYCVVSSKSTSGATIKAYNNSGTAITARVDIRVKGY